MRLLIVRNIMYFVFATLRDSLLADNQALTLHNSSFILLILFILLKLQYNVVSSAYINDAGELTYVLMGSPGHYQLIIMFLKLSFFSSDILHDICLNKLFVIVIVIVTLAFEDHSKHWEYHVDHSKIEKKF